MSELSLAQQSTDIQKEEKRGLRRKLKVSTVDIPIQQSRLKESNSKVFISGYTKISGSTEQDKRAFLLKCLLLRNYRHLEYPTSITFIGFFNCLITDIVDSAIFLTWSKPGNNL